MNRAETTGSDMAEKISGTFNILAQNKVSTGLDKKGRKVLISDTTLAIDVVVPRIQNPSAHRQQWRFVIQQSLNLTATFIRLLAFDFKRWSAERTKGRPGRASLN